ncbi:MAG: hypothetical protein V2B18_18495, partial [Pseudomonadota bacterium]
LGSKKSGDGLMSVKWFREGRMDLVEEYCRKDVALTLDLYRHGLMHGHLVHRAKSGGLFRVPASWAGPR